MDNSVFDLYKRLLNTSIEMAYERDVALISQRGQERAFVFRIGSYLERQLRNSRFAELNLDSEYNRNLNDRKRTINFPNGIQPDLILHSRGNNSGNALCIEFKGWWNPQGEKDIKKLIDLTHPDGDYKYDLGAFVTFGREGFKIQYVSNGVLISDTSEQAAQLGLFE